ncbi:MAG: lytic transglycosylase domain-containing protein, partial [Halothiobacillus sp.]
MGEYFKQNSAQADAIGRVESGGNPWTIGVNGHYVLPRQPKSRAEAVREANRLIGMGYNIDMGVMQVNVKNLSLLNLSVEQVFDPCTNIKAGAQILQNFYLKSAKDIGQGQKSLKRALSAYNTGNFRNGFANGYVAKVTRDRGTHVQSSSVVQAMLSRITVAWQG